jgi:beta-phosphoglucomutase-like phosphatase (HAD superfamily)
VVDLDGTLVNTNLLLESLLALCKKDLLCLFLIPLWLLRGTEYLKRQISQRVAPDLDALPYNRPLLDFLKAQRAQGRSLILATGEDERLARQVAKHLELFDSVLASEDGVNLSPPAKRDRLVADFGEKGFDYAGDGRHDLVVWA